MQGPIAHELILCMGSIFFNNKMGSSNMKKVLGEVSNEVVQKWELDEYKNKKIVMYSEAEEHSRNKLIGDYKNVRGNILVAVRVVPGK